MKLSDLKIGVRLGWGFTTIILFLIVVSVFTIRYMNILSELTVKLHKHPYTVSTAALRINAGIIKMHRSMKDVALADDAGGKAESFIKEAEDSRQKALSITYAVQKFFISRLLVPKLQLGNQRFIYRNEKLLKGDLL